MNKSCEGIRIRILFERTRRTTTQNRLFAERSYPINTIINMIKTEQDSDIHKDNMLANENVIKLPEEDK